MKFNIALIHYSCPPVVGGVEEIIRQQASLFKRFYHNVKVFSGDGKTFSKHIDVEINPLLGSRNRRVLNAHKVSREGDTEIIESLIGEIYKYLVNSLEGFDLVIAHNVLSMAYNLPLSAALHRIGQEGILPVISWNHDSPYFYPNYPKYLDTFPWNMLKRAYAGIHYVAISESRKQMFSHLYGSRKHLHAIPNGIDPIRFFQLDTTTVRLIREERLFEAEFLLIQPSRLHPRKNMELSVQVTRALHDLGIHSRILITGAHDPHEAKSSEYYKKLKRLAREEGVEKDVLIIAEYVFPSGECLTADRIIIRDLYLLADMLFLPSLQEGFGIPILESGMIKLPVACSNIPPFMEIGGQDVCIFDLQDPPLEIARKIMSFLEDLKPHKLYRKVIGKYVWDNIYHNMILPLLHHVVRSS
jgi:glycosyltransferase involved in cell wall biosynthesis